MFGSEILDVAVGLVFLYLLLSLLASALNELIEARLRTRAADLERGIRELLRNGADGDWAQKLYNHPLVFGLFPGEYTPPPSAPAEKTEAGKHADAAETARAAVAAEAEKVNTATDDAAKSAAIEGAWEHVDRAWEAANRAAAAARSARKQSDAVSKVGIANRAARVATESAKEATEAVMKACAADGDLRRMRAADATARARRAAAVMAPPEKVSDAVQAVAEAERAVEEAAEAVRKRLAPAIQAAQASAAKAGPLPDHPLRTKSNLPAYIPSRTFALALTDIVLGHMPGRQPGSVPSLHDLRLSVDLIRNEHVRGALAPLIDAAAGDIDQARKNVERWFDDAMDRVSGWYKRRSQYIIFCIGLAVAIALNADSVAIGKSLLHDKPLRDSLVAAAEEYARKGKGDEPAAPEQRVRQNAAQIRKLGLPLGWDSNDDRRVPSGAPYGQAVFNWLMKIFGWFATAFAVSLGAPFWFDLLNKMMVIRSTVKPREKSPEEASEDRQQPIRGAAGRP